MQERVRAELIEEGGDDCCVGAAGLLKARFLRVYSFFFLFFFSLLWHRPFWGGLHTVRVEMS